jgi:virginiamycin B lyase
MGMRRWLERGLLTVATAGVLGVAGVPSQAAQRDERALGAISEFPTAPGSRPLAIVTGRDGALWFTENGANRIGRMTSAGVLTDEWTVPTPNSQPDGIAIGPDGSVWFAEVLGNKIGRLRPDRAIVEYPVPTPDSRPTEVTVGPDGHVWFTERGTAAAPGSKVGNVDPSTGIVTDYVVRTGSRPLGIVAGPDGNLWFTEQAGNNVGRISTAGVLLAEYAMPHANSQPWEPTSGPDGAIWFTQAAGNRIGRLTVDGTLTEFAVPTAGSVPNVIVSGPDPDPAQSHSLWFAETGADKIGRITTTGVVTEFSIPSADTQPVGVAAGPDGQVWFAESAAATGNRIGRLLVTPLEVPVGSGVGGTVPATLALSVGGPVSFGPFTPGVARTYDAATTANVVSTAGDAALSVADPSPAAAGHLVNGPFSLPQALTAKASSAAGTGRAYTPVGGSASPTTLLTYAGPTSNDAVAVSFEQSIGASDALRTGSYAKTLTFTLSTTAP